MNLIFQCVYEDVKKDIEMVVGLVCHLITYSLCSWEVDKLPPLPVF